MLQKRLNLNFGQQDAEVEAMIETEVEVTLETAAGVMIKDAEEAQKEATENDPVVVDAHRIGIDLTAGNDIHPTHREKEDAHKIKIRTNPDLSVGTEIKIDT